MEEVEKLQQQLKEMGDKVEFLENSLKQSQKNLIKEALSEFLQQNKKDNLKSEVLRKFSRSRKNIIKQKIAETIRQKPMNLADLKFQIVNQLNYCSKASFYRYISEMKNLVEIKDDVVYPIAVVER